MAKINNLQAHEKRLKKALNELAKGNKYYKGDTRLEIARAEGLVYTAKNYQRDYKIVKEK